MGTGIARNPEDVQVDGLQRRYSAQVPREPLIYAASRREDEEENVDSKTRGAENEEGTRGIF